MLCGTALDLSGHGLWLQMRGFGGLVTDPVGGNNDRRTVIMTPTDVVHQRRVAAVTYAIESKNVAETARVLGSARRHADRLSGLVYSISKTCVQNLLGGHGMGRRSQRHVLLDNGCWWHNQPTHPWWWSSVRSPNTERPGSDSPDRLISTSLRSGEHTEPGDRQIASPR